MLRSSFVRSVIVTLAAPALAVAALQARGGIRMISISGGAEGTHIVLDAPGHPAAQAGDTDRFGSLIFRELDPGSGYVVHGSAGGSFTQDVTVLAFDDLPPQSLYDGQHLVEGFQYIQMRDGTLLAATVRAPLGASLANGPFPTVVEYSGYDTANPDGPQPVSLIASFLGFATVGVNMRGSGCSGGVIDLFDLPTTADGYDVIETVASQPWVAGGKVGMVGISFSGISQLFVGGARPPHLAALTPLSTIADIYRAPGFPGGIFNNGFAQSWLEERASDARPAPEGGQPYAIKRVNQGDQTCLANQKLRLQTQDPVAVTKAFPYYEPALMDARSPINWVDKIDVPTFYSSSWQDEQTGGDFASMMHRFPRRKDFKVTLQNGVHTSSLDPQVLWNWISFLDIYVAHRVPNPSRITPIASIIYGMIMGDGTPRPPLPVDRFDNVADLDAARKIFEADPRFRVLMENGGGSPIPGIPAPTFELAARGWPPPQRHPQLWYFGPNGTLVHGRTGAHADGGVDGYHPDPTARPMLTLGGGQSDPWAVVPTYDWEPIRGTTGVGYTSPALDRNVTIAGPSSVDLWLRSSAPDTDIQVTLSEVRPDGLETYVQSGWLRASHRKLDRRRSNILEPVPTHLERDAKPMPAGQFVRARVGLYHVAHVFRAGSRIRVTVEAPGGDRTSWAFDTPLTDGMVLNEVARTHAQPSRLVLPVVPANDVPDAYPPCPGLRGQPCRVYAPAANGG